MKAYRYITGPDNDDFCHRITEALNRGWALGGPATLTYDSKRERVICGQTLIKDLPDQEYSPDVDLRRI